MGPELDLKPNSEALAKAPSVHKGNPSINQDSQDNLLPCVSNDKDRSIYMRRSPVKQTVEPDRTDNEEINVTDVTHSFDAGVMENDCIDAIETSSSFGDTVSLTDNGEVLDEIQSQLRGDHTSVSEYEGYYDMFRMRNKKLTAHWRRYIRPLMWRCKWMELQIKKLQSQVLAYDTELAQYDERKKFEYEWSTSQEFDAKSQPFPGQFRRNKAMKRTKRKRVEDTVDIVSYMSQHNFFSYYENKRSVPDGASMEVDLGNQGKASYHDDEFGTSDGFSLEFQDGESSFETVFRKIEIERSRVRDLMLRLDKVVAENSAKISSMNKLRFGIPCDASVRSAQNSAPPEENGNGLQVESLSIGSEDTCERNVADLLMIDGAISGHGEVTPRSDQLQTEDEVLIDNEQAKEELHDFEKFRDQFGDKPLVSEENHPPPALEVVSVPSKANTRTKGRKRKRKTRSRK